MDKLTKEKRSWNMSRIRSKDTKPELLVRRYLHAQGIRYRINTKEPGRPDIAIKKIKTAVFINGCFWHGHKNCKDSGTPKTNTAFWEEKIAGNVARDKRNYAALMSMGWSVKVIWECELAKTREETLGDLTTYLNTALNR